jgi:hypothetical protein
VQRTGRIERTYFGLIVSGGTMTVYLSVKVIAAYQSWMEGNSGMQDHVW